MAFDRNDSVIWVDGEFVPWQDAKVHLLTHTLHYGVGAIEGLRVYDTEKGPAIFRLQDHTDRLFRSAKILSMPVPYEKEFLNEAQKEVVSKNKFSSCYIRPMVFYGSGSLGLHTKNLTSHVMIAAWQWDGAYLGENSINGIKVHTSSYARNHVNSVLCKAKANGHYMNSILALKEAQAAGCDETLLLDHQGFVAEGSAENIFIVRDNVLLTPELTSVLEGITRDSICRLATDLGLQIKEKRITRDEVYIADEAFFTGTAAEVVPIRELDNRIIGDGKPGKITQQLRQLYADVVRGKNNQYANWLSYI